MQPTWSLREKGQQLLTILWPIFITQLMIYSMSLVDTIMSGHAGTNDLAGVAIGSSLWTPIFSGVTGVLIATTPIIAQHLGANRRDKIPFTVIQGIYIAIAISLFIIMGGTFVLKPILSNMNLDAPVRDIAYHYLMGLSIGIAPLFIYTILRCFIESLGKTRITMMITLTSLPINVTLNYLLIFGKLGFPRLGGAGAGYATGITYWCILLITLWTVHKVKPFADYQVFKKWHPISLTAWKNQLQLGIPIGLSIFFEGSFFAAVTLLMSQYSTITIAAHQAAMNFASFLYMVPLSISMALTIAVGYEVGAKRYQDAKQYSFLGLGIALGLAVCCGVAILLFKEQVAGLYTQDRAVLQLSQQFLMFAIFFQLSDAIVTPVQGILRGYKDVNIASIVTFTSFWIVGLPLGHILSTYGSWGAFGYWIGFIVGLAIGAVFLLSRMVILQRKVVARRLKPVC
ncbi:MATE family efflux transporter [Peptococcaceae bacterium 1198_IL3148]